jgi:predicted RNA binding protein YcfA (HicA-like mRNA interferase family)
MSEKLPAVTPKQTIRALQKAGFFIRRQRGSHVYLQHRDDPTRLTIVPMHSRDIAPGTLRAILKQTRLSREEFLELVK